MIMDLKTRLLIGIVVAVASLMLCSQPAAGANKQLIPLRNLKQLLDVAKEIESASTNDRKPMQSTDQGRRELFYLFAREDKSTICEAHYQKVTKLFTDYKVKAHEFVEDIASGANNWFKSVITLGGAIGAMKNIGKSDEILASITRRYEGQEKMKIPLTHDDVDCDMLKYRIRHLKDMVFVLQTDVRHLILGETQILNRAIYEKLKADNYMSATNFHDIQELTPKQTQLVLDYFASRVDLETTVGEAVDHFLSLKSFIIGRLIDSCQSLEKYTDSWSSLEAKRLEVCEKSKSDQQNHFFSREFKLEAFSNTKNFCNDFLQAL